MSVAPCNCFVAQHPRADDISEALQGGEDPRLVAARFGIGKSKAYEHRQHLRAAGATATPARPVQAPPVPHAAPTLAAPRTAEPFRGTVEPRVESDGTNEPTNVPTSAITSRALPMEPPASRYATAVAAAVELITDGRWRPAHVDALVQKYGLAKNSARSAHAEAVRHIQLNMGDYLARQGVSAAYVTHQRDEAKAQSRTAIRHAERWRGQEAEAQKAADKLEDRERFAMLDMAARFGMLATKYDLAAEKWSAQSLAHQRHLDDVLCLKTPNLTQINIGESGPVLLEKFGAALAARFAGRPDVLRELEAAVAAIEGGDAGAIETTGEAA
jgi:hypothetical protein